ncbi:MAG: thioesterase family protein [Spirochaetota bacterium]
MNYVKINLPEKFDFETEIAIVFGDINYGNHLSNDAILRLTNEARIRFLYSMGLSDFDISGGNNVSVVMRNAVIVYKAEGFHGDIINAKVTVGDYQNNDFEAFFQLVRVSDSKEIARVQTGIVCFDRINRKPVPVPEFFLSKLDEHRKKIKNKLTGF